MPIIEVKNISKKYNIQHKADKYLALRDSLSEAIKHPLDFIVRKKTVHEDFWALKDISFNVEQGEVIGIIGANGAGKSTLLKILTGITPPTSGQAIMRGKVSSLLEVGTGFHPELTGRENIFLNGALLGMPKKEIIKKFDEIVDFAGIEKFLDTPVKHYSSGMYVRLAFSVAAHLEPDILLVDEVLAVGDAEFQKKCLGKMSEVTKKSGRTILFVSHNMGAIQSLCSKCVLLKDGKTEMIGKTNEVIEQYTKEIFQNELNNPNIKILSKTEEVGGPKIESVSIVDNNNKYRMVFSSTEDFKVKINIKPSKIIDQQYSVVWFLYNQLGEEIAVGASSPICNISYSTTKTKEVFFSFYPETLIPMKYYFRFVLHVPGQDNFDEWNHAIGFEIIKNDFYNTGYNYPGIWNAKIFVKHYWCKP